MNVSSASVSAYERVKHLESRTTHHRSFALLLMALFFILLIGMLAAGALAYGHVAEKHASGDALRVQTGMFSNALHAFDSRDAVSVRQGPEGPSLVLVETLSTGTYETRIYQAAGEVCMEYAIAGRPYNPDIATKLFASTSFNVTMADGLVHIETDLGPVDLAVRSGQGGGA